MKLEGKITKRGLEISKTKLIEKFNENGYKKLLRKFIIKYKSPIGTFFIEKKNYNIDKDDIIFPRFGTSDLLNYKIIESIENLIPIGKSINIKYTGTPTYNQEIIINHIFKNIYNEENRQNGLCGVTLNALAGCHKKDTKIIMYDGRIKMVQDIKLNDLLMGDDNTPRKVLNLCRGNEMMYKISNDKNESYIVNENHILCLIYIKNKNIRDIKKKYKFIVNWFDNVKIKNKKKVFYYKDNNKENILQLANYFLNDIKEDLKVDISVIDYLKLNNHMQKMLYGYKSQVNFSEIDIPVDPYIIGSWLGNNQYNEKNNIDYNIFLNELIKLNLINNKFIPYNYKCNSRQNQLKLLAGILDNIICINKNGKITFNQPLENKIFINDILYICGCLGFECYKKIIILNNKKTFKVRINTKKSLFEKHHDILYSRIFIEKLENDDYYGFILDKNHRYLMKNFTVLHNSGKTFTAMNIINRIKLKTLIVVPNTYLLKQWVELLEEFFPENKIGQYYGKIKEDGDIVVAIINSLINDDFTFSSINLINVEENKNGKVKIKTKKEKVIISKSYKEYYNEFGFVILDESHIYCTDSFKVVYNRFQSTYMLGLSATPNERVNNCDIISHLNIGKVLIANEIEDYQNDSTKFSTQVSIVKYNGPHKYTNIHINESTKMICVPKIIEEIINDEYRNKLIIDQIYELFYLKLNIFVFSERRSNLEYLYEQFNYLLDDKNIEKDSIKDSISIPELDINKNIVLYGNSSNDDILTAKTNSNIIFTTYAYSSTGVSINRMTAMILATPRRSKSVQIIGRIFRLNKENNHIKRIIIDIVDNKTVLKNQLYERMKAYKERNAEIEIKSINYTDITF